MKKYIFRQIPAEYADFSFYFDGDTFTGAAGNYGYNLFIIDADRWGRISGYNTEEYKTVQGRVSDILEGFAEVADGATNYDGKKETYKDIIEAYGITYNPRKCHMLKEWAKKADETEPEDIAAFLSIETGKPWTVTEARGYCQGDYVQIVYCADYYSSQAAKAAGEIYLGAGNEYEFITVEDGEEVETVGGYFVADCQAWRPEDVKKLLCSWEGVDEAETELQFVDDCKIRREYRYKTAC